MHLSLITATCVKRYYNYLFEKIPMQTEYHQADLKFECFKF
jgi:hypothetical protein